MTPVTTAGEVRLVTSEYEKKYGLPEGTLYKQAGIESNFGNAMLSPKGAQGWFGFMSKTAKEYGVTDPHDLRNSADGAGRKMRDLLAQHSGNMDYALVDYNGGHRAVKALMAGKPWAESAGYLEKFHGASLDEIMARRPVQPMGDQFTSQTSVSPSDGPNAGRLGYADAERDRKYGGVTGFASNVFDAVALGFETQNSTWNFFKDKTIDSLGEPLDWRSQEAKDALGQFPEAHWPYLQQSVTKEELASRSTRLRTIMEKEKELGGMGLPLALTGGIAGSIPSVENLVALIPFVGEAGMLTKAGRVSNAIRLGVSGAASNVAFDAVANQYKPTATPDDLYMSALMGLGFGAFGGSLMDPKKIALREENMRLGEIARRRAAEGIRGEVDEFLKGPKPVLPFEYPPREEFLKKLDEWSGGLGRQPPEKPKMAIFQNGPEDAPTVPHKGRGEGPEGSPRVRPEDPPDVHPGSTTGKPWGPEWDTPTRVNRLGAPEILMLPPLSKISHLADYVRLHTTNPDIAALMDRALKSLDLRKLKFDVIDPKVDPSTLKVSGKTARHMEGAYGVVVTPHGSNGDGIEMALRGYGWGQRHNGLNEETFTHELLHAATVYKWHRVSSGNTAGMKAETVQAFKELDKLYRNVKGQAKGRTDLPERFDVNMQNPREFISYGLTDRSFQEWLMTVQVGGAQTTLWSHFTQSLRKLLGMSDGEGHAYAKLIDLTEGLLNKSGIEGSRKTRADLAARSSYIDKADVEAANDAGLNAVYGVGLGLEHRTQGQAVPAPVRELSAKLMGTTVGYKGHAVVERNVWNDTIAKAEGWTAETRKVGYAAFDAWFKESGRLWHQKGPAFQEFGQEVSDYIRGFERDFHPEVVKAGNKIREVNARVADEINNPALHEGGVKKGLTETEVLDDTGATVLVGKLEKNPNYLARKHDSQKWDEAVRMWGREAVESWWANAYRKVHPERTPEEAGKWAGWYVRTVEEAHMNRSADHLEEMMSGFDEKALKESLMRNGGFSEGEAFGIIKGMFQKPSSDAGRTASSLRHRNHISETHTETWKNAAGEEVEININDFIKSNAFDVQESYYRRTASSIALAHRLDVYKQSDIGSLIDKATAKGFGSDISDATSVKMKSDLKFAFDRVQGIPQEEWSAWNKGFEMWRDFNVIRLMGGAVWNQATELSQVVGTMGWKATMNAVSELKALRRDMATGKAPHDLLDHLENTIGGVGSEYVARLDFKPKDDWVRYKGDSKMNQRLDAMDAGLKKMAKGVLDYTGMTGVMVQQKRVHAIALTNHFVNVANGAPNSFLTKERLAWMGMSEADHAELNAGIKAYSKPGTGQYGKKADFDFKRFAAEKPELNSMLMNALHRESRRVVQENDLASMVPLMGTTLGKTVFQFMNFTIHGWNKSMLFGMNHKDFATLSAVLHGSLFASLAYMGRTQLSSLGMDEEKRKEFLEKRLAPKQIIANSFGKISQASLLPQVYDTTLGNFTGPMFSGMRTTSDVSSFASNPTLQAVNGFLSLGKIARNAVSDETQTSAKDIKTWAKLVPLNNIAPISTFFNALANDYPTSDKQD